MAAEHLQRVIIDPQEALFEDAIHAALFWFDGASNVLVNIVDNVVEKPADFGHIELRKFAWFEVFIVVPGIIR